MKKNCLLLLTSIILLLTFISCDSLWRITGRGSVSFSIDLGDLSLPKTQTSMQPRSSILYNGLINNTVEYTVSLHFASNDSEIASQVLTPSYDSEDSDSSTIVRFDNVLIVGKNVYAKVVVLKDGKLFVGKSNAQRMVAGDNFLSITDVALDPNSVGNITFVSSDAAVGEGTEFDDNFDPNVDSMISLKDLIETYEGLNLVGNVATITYEQAKNKGTTVAQFILKYYNRYGGTLLGTNLTIDLSKVPPRGTIVFHSYGNPALEADLTNNIIDTNDDGIFDQSVQDIMEDAGYTLDIGSASTTIQGPEYSEIISILLYYQRLYGGNLSGTELTININDMKQEDSVIGMITFTDGSDPAYQYQLYAVYSDTNGNGTAGDIGDVDLFQYMQDGDGVFTGLSQASVTITGLDSAIKEELQNYNNILGGTLNLDQLTLAIDINDIEKATLVFSPITIENVQVDSPEYNFIQDYFSAVEGVQTVDDGPPLVVNIELPQAHLTATLEKVKSDFEKRNYTSDSLLVNRLYLYAP